MFIGQRHRRIRQILTRHANFAQIAHIERTKERTNVIERERQAIMKNA